MHLITQSVIKGLGSNKANGMKYTFKTHDVLHYETEAQARAAMRRFTKRYFVHPDCTMDVVCGGYWNAPRNRWLIRLTGRDGSVGYWHKSERGGR